MTRTALMNIPIFEKHFQRECYGKQSKAGLLRSNPHVIQGLQPYKYYKALLKPFGLGSLEFLFQIPSE